MKYVSWMQPSTSKKRIALPSIISTTEFILGVIGIDFLVALAFSAQGMLRIVKVWVGDIVGELGVTLRVSVGVELTCRDTVAGAFSGSNTHDFVGTSETVGLCALITVFIKEGGCQ